MKKTEYRLIDSSVWLAYLFNGSHSEIIDSEGMLLLSALSLFEIKKKLTKSKIEGSKITRSMEFIKKRSLVIPVSGEIAEKAADSSIKSGLPIIDSLIYETAMLNDSVLVTLDNDFRGLKSAVVL